jgi:predicted Rossmann fold nucleotide-binding protein DprA/Smf involved in DNA uptake
MVTSGEDILNALNWIINIEKTDTEADSSLPLEYLTLLDIINIEPLGFDEIQTKTGLNTEELLKTLTLMEIEGYIEQTDGDRYKRGKQRR